MISHPYKFIAVMAGLLVFALVVVVIVWFRFQQAIMEPTSPATQEDVTTQQSDSTVENPATTSESATTSPDTQAEAALSVSAETAPPLPLTSEQQALAEKLGIDVSAITITPALIACVEDALGADRYAAITSGGTPTFLEGLSMVRCLGQ